MASKKENRGGNALTADTSFRINLERKDLKSIKPCSGLNILTTGKHIQILENDMITQNDKFNDYLMTIIPLP
jgi:hypothetical protein